MREFDSDKGEGSKNLKKCEDVICAVADVRARGGHVGGAVHTHGGPADVRNASGGAHQDQGEITEPD